MDHDAHTRHDRQNGDIPRILVVVGDVDVRRAVSTVMRNGGFCVSTPTDASAALLLADAFQPDVVLVDVHLTTCEHTPLYRNLRQRDAAVVCLTGDDDHSARVTALRHGVDDAVRLSIHDDELVARCEALLRRRRMAASNTRRHESARPAAPATLSVGPFTVDLGRRVVAFDGVEIRTTRIEFSLFEQLCRRSTEVCSRQELLDAVWGPHWVGDNHVVDVHLSNLRRKLAGAAPDVKVIHTVRGIGFRLAVDIQNLPPLAAVTEIPGDSRLTLVS